jgi:site-specific recombinase XerD
VAAYRDALKLLLRFTAESQKCSVAELAFAHFDRETILSFLESLETLRANATTTRNHRLAAIRSFFRFVSSSSPELVELCAQVLGIPQKRADSQTVDYLTVDEVNAILACINQEKANWRRDDALLRFMYNTGARVQEMLDVRAIDLQLTTPAHVVLHGKGGKERICPLWPETVVRLKSLLEANQLDSRSDLPVFRNGVGKALTRFGVRYILSKYVRAAAEKQPALSRKEVHPHTLRHTTAMHLLQSGVDVNTIRCWLGHASVVTTNRYVEIDLEMKRRALESVNPPGGGELVPVQDATLLSWLESL